MMQLDNGDWVDPVHVRAVVYLPAEKHAVRAPYTTGPLPDRVRVDYGDFSSVLEFADAGAAIAGRDRIAKAICEYKCSVR